MNLFQTSVIDIINDGYAMFNFKRISDLILERRRRFLLEYGNECSNLVCTLHTNAALPELTRLLPLNAFSFLFHGAAVMANKVPI